MVDEWVNDIIQHDPMRVYRARRDRQHVPVTAKYGILGFISSGTYGRVYKAHSLEDTSELFAIKKFKPDKEGDVVTYTGISQSAIREIAVRLPPLQFIMNRTKDWTSLTEKSTTKT